MTYLFFTGAPALIAVAIILGVTLSRDGHHEHDEETEKDSDKSTKKSEPLSAYDWTSPTEKAYGVALGNWLLLERWMDEDWFTSTANEDVYDEWGWCEAVAAKGDNVTEVLQERFNHFIVEGDIQDMYQAGVKQVRIPIGFWALIPTEEDEPYVNAGQLGQIDRILPVRHF